MTPPNNTECNDSRFFVYMDDDEAETNLEVILKDESLHDRIEQLASLLISFQISIGQDKRELLKALGSDSDRPFKAELELDRMVEILFKQSEAYGHALELYERRFDIKGGDPERLIAGLVKKYLDSGEDEGSSSNEQRGNIDSDVELFGKLLRDRGVSNEQISKIADAFWPDTPEEETVADEKSEAASNE